MVVVPIFLAAALDGGRETTPLLVDKFPITVLFFCSGARGFIGLTWDIVILGMVFFLGEIAFAVALDLTGREVAAGFGMVVGRVTVVLVVTVGALAVDLVADVVVVRFAEAIVGLILVVVSLWEEAVTGRAFVTGIFEGVTLGFTVTGVGFDFSLEVDGSRNRASPSSSGVGTE